MTVEEKKKKLNALMMEYSQLKGNPDNKGRCRSIKNEVANIIWSPDFYKLLRLKVRKAIANYNTMYQPDDFITETFMRYVEKYDYNINSNFYAFFLDYLKFTITNMLRTEHPEWIIDIRIEDEEGNEVDYISTIVDPGANIETIVDINMLFGETLSEEEAITRQRFIEYFSKLIPCIIQSMEHRGNRNEYYRAFASDFYIASCKSSLYLRYDMNEKEAFSNMDLGFADFTLSDICRSFAKIEKTPCRMYSEIGVSGASYSNREIETPFRNGVYSKYFEVTDGLISQRKKSFYKDIGILVREES